MVQEEINKYTVYELLSKKNLEDLLRMIEQKFPTLDTNSYRRKHRSNIRVVRKKLGITRGELKKLMELIPGYEKKWLQS